MFGWKKGTKQPDNDNARAWVKAMQDGLSDYFSGGDDRGWICDAVLFEEVEKAGEQFTRFELAFV